MVKLFLYTSVFVTSLSACNTLSSSQQAQVDSMTNCEKLEALVKHAKNNFTPLKASEIKTPFLTSWYSKVHFIGEQCQISEYASGNTGYHCEQNFEALPLAQSIYSKSQTSLSNCLNDNWSRQLTDNDVVFTRQPEKTKVHLLLKETFNQKKPWQIKLEVLYDNKE